MAHCRACSLGNSNAITKLKRADSIMLANKLRYSVLKHIEPSSNQTYIGSANTSTGLGKDKSECFNGKNYSLLEMFEGDELDQKLAQLSVQDLESIVEQECKDVSCALTMARKNNIDIHYGKTSSGEPKTMCRQANGNILTSVCDTDEDITADVVAKMLHAAEIKSALTARPEVIYNLLFDDAEYEPLPMNTAAYNTLHNDIVVPIGPPANLNTDPDLTEAARFYYGRFQDDSSQSSNTSQELQSQITKSLFTHSALGGEPTNLEQLLYGTQDIPSDISATLSDFEFLIEPEEPKYQSFAQLRGSVPPPWFPDYNAMFPDSLFGNFQKIDNPMEVLERAWQYVQPAAMKPAAGVQLMGN